MERKTKIHAEEGKHDVLITREFDLPLELLFKAYEDPELIAEWMNTKVLKLENKNHGGYQFETTSPKGDFIIRMNGVYHLFVPNQRIIRTFEMENTPYPVHLEFLEFEKITGDTSRLTMLMIYKSTADRDAMLKLPFAQGINMAHNQLQKIVNKLK
jgi:uncharacterized protein YndB with AHSA1/START domain